jgi:hypothetical protein
VNLVALADRITSTARYETPGDLAAILEPRTVATAALAVLDRALVDAADGKAARLIFSMPPQEGKSQRVSQVVPALAAPAQPHTCASPSFLRRRAGPPLGPGHPQRDLGPPGTWAARRGHLPPPTSGSSTATTAGSSPRASAPRLTGRPVDVIIIDDPVKGYAEQPTPRCTARRPRTGGAAPAARDPARTGSAGRPDPHPLA